MTDKQSIDRRHFLATGGIVFTSAMAGCLHIQDHLQGIFGNDPEAADRASGPTSVDKWLSDTDNYTGSIMDQTGMSSVTVEVGPDDNEFVFTPPAIRISSGTTVTWNWIGSGTHNVVATDEQFRSGVPESNATFKYTFESTGTVYYYCDPHQEMGMKGAVVVADSANAEQLSTDHAQLERR